jgi:lysyl-tRNA synthetase class 2
MMTRQLLLIACMAAWAPAAAFVAMSPRILATKSSVLRSSSDPIVSPFDNSEDGGSDAVATTTTTEKLEGPLELTWDNVEAVLDEMRHFLIQDGGNVAIKEIDGPVVRLELQVRPWQQCCRIGRGDHELESRRVIEEYSYQMLYMNRCFYGISLFSPSFSDSQGACGTCPSSTQTMKMGLERGLREKIPEIQEVIQAMPEGPPLGEDQINVVLDGVRPFLQVAGGTIDIDRIEGVDGLQPTIWLHMKGASASLNSVKLEIAQRLQRHVSSSHPPPSSTSALLTLVHTLTYYAVHDVRTANSMEIALVFNGFNH